MISSQQSKEVQRPKLNTRISFSSGVACHHPGLLFSAPARHGEEQEGDEKAEGEVISRDGIRQARIHRRLSDGRGDGGGSSRRVRKGRYCRGISVGEYHHGHVNCRSEGITLPRLRSGQPADLQEMARETGYSLRAGTAHGHAVHRPGSEFGYLIPARSGFPSGRSIRPVAALAVLPASGRSSATEAAPWRRGAGIKIAKEVQPGSPREMGTGDAQC
jgi:hypothetical protein